MFSFWVNDTTIFPVTQAWHLHTMPALIIVKYNFDYFTPFKNILWQFFSLESKLPWPPFLTLFSPSPTVHHMLLSELDCWGPSGPHSVFQVPLAESGPHGLKSIYPSFSWKKIPVKSLLFPSLLPFFFFFDSWYWIKHFHFLSQKSFHSFSKTLEATKPSKSLFQNSSLI